MTTAEEEKELAEQTSSPGIHYPPPLIFVIVFGLSGLINKYIPVSLAGIEQTLIGKVLAFLLCIAGAFLMFSSIYIFLRNRTPVYPNSPATTLVTSGPYRFTRNPMYMGLCLLYVAGAIFMNSLWPLILLPIAVWFISRFVITSEEAHLEATFGDGYREFQASVRRWF